MTKRSVTDVGLRKLALSSPVFVVATGFALVSGGCANDIADFNRQPALSAVGSGLLADRVPLPAEPSPQPSYRPGNSIWQDSSADLFKVKPYFLSDEFSMVDATIAPILWRLPRYEIDLPPQAQPILKYASTIFSRPAFRASLSENEREMRLA